MKRQMRPFPNDTNLEFNIERVVIPSYLRNEYLDYIQEMICASDIEMVKSLLFESVTSIPAYQFMNRLVGDHFDYICDDTHIDVVVSAEDKKVLRFRIQREDAVWNMI